MCTQRRFRSTWASVKSDQFSLSTRRNLSSLATYNEDLSDWADTHVDLILPWKPSDFVGFDMRWKTIQISRPITLESTGAVSGQWLSY